jgi:hypothetical protein
MMKCSFDVTRKVFGALALLALSACNTIPPAGVVSCEKTEPSAVKGPALVGTEYGQVNANPIPLNSVLFSSTRLAEQVSVQSITASRTAAGTVKIDARILGCSGKPINLVARAHFLGQNQSPVEPLSAWKTLPLQGGGISYFTELSVTKDVKFYLVELDVDR